MLGNQDVSFRRGITMHEGNNPKDTHGCLLPGSSWKSDFVGGSVTTRNTINSYIKGVGYKKVKVNIFDAF